MKRLLLCGASALGLAFATSAWADSSYVNLSQSGDHQTADINQTGNNSVGAWWGAFSQSNGDGGLGGNDLKIVQTGSSNTVSRDTSGWQAGTGNKADINQSGANSDVELQQSGTNNGVAVQAGGAGNGVWFNSPNYNTIIQDSSASSAKTSVTQNGVNSVFDIIQGGSGNNLSLTQSSTGNYGSMAYIRQSTSEATSDSQGFTFPYGGSSNGMTVNQNNTGSYVYAVAVQGGGDGNSLTILQNGDGLNANIWQDGGYNTASLTQSGLNQNAGVLDGADKPFKQIGSSNTLTAYQSNAGGSLNGSQTGINNYIYSSQYGTGDKLSVTQLAYGGYQNYLSNNQSGAAEAKITQTSYWLGGNSITSSQGGTAYAEITQDGSSNTVNSTQDGGAKATLTQTGAGHNITGSQSGGANTVTVSQTGNGNNANYAQAGNNLTATITQH